MTRFTDSIMWLLLRLFARPPSKPDGDWSGEDCSAHASSMAGGGDFGDVADRGFDFV
eukprot:CAMPEP_0204633472 /NCGR_PEP_ID=MMETSP0717-20131115/27288_1 /ASSEMBLY_ACC=CAM_ASM_000666 /TAXON_ID=230516 /ORGANISM="Chaetoceros curvisetus" /LENGTH=56 /DNA_ID=CAMNT_0051651649 /DNA_START=221 /DNA_END=387 /DNA_ORIENTATION=-